LNPGWTAFPHCGQAPRSGLSQDKVKKDAEKVGNQNRHNRPKDGAHPATFRVAVDVADKQQTAAPANAGQQPE